MLVLGVISLFRIEKVMSLLKNLKVEYDNFVDDIRYELWIVCGFKDFSKEGVSVG